MRLWCGSHMWHLVDNLDQRLNRFLGPPHPKRTDGYWFNPVKGPTRRIDKWYSRDAKTPAESGFELGRIKSDPILCEQRGYLSKGVYESFCELVASSFDAYSNATDVQRAYRLFAFDFILYVSVKDKVVAGCLLEFRTAPGQPSYLYLSTLCTSKQHRHEHLATGLLQAAHKLGCLMLENNAQEGAWNLAITAPFYLGLTVYDQRPTTKTLLKLYGGHGFKQHHEDRTIPQFTYKSFTPYSEYSWAISCEPDLIPMFRRIELQPTVCECEA